jgi:hypothetical protein
MNEESPDNPPLVSSVPKSYWEMTDDEKREWVTNLLKGFRGKIIVEKPEQD